MLKKNVIIFLCFLPFTIAEAAQDNNPLSRLIEQKKFPQAEYFLRQLLNEQKYSPQLQFKLAQILSWQKKYNLALTEYDVLLSKFPTDGDYILGKARTLYWAGRNKKALLLLESKKVETDSNKEAWRLKIKILEESSDEISREKIKPLLLQAKKRFPDELWGDPIELNIKPLVDISYTEVEAGYSSELLSNGFDSWSSMYLSAEHQFMNSNKIYTTITQTERFNLKDTEYLLGFYTPIDSKWNALLETSYSPLPKVLSQWSAYIQLKHLFDYGWNSHIAWRQTGYLETDTQAFRWGVERYWKDYRMSYTLSLSQLNATAVAKDTFLSHLISADYFYGEKNVVGAGITSGQELEYSGRPNPPVSNIFAYYLKGRHWFTAKWAVSYDMSFHQQGTNYSRLGYRLGLRYRY